MERTEEMLARRQHELDVDKWIASEAAGYDLCGSFTFCARCERMEMYPCARAEARWLEEQAREVAAFEEEQDRLFGGRQRSGRTRSSYLRSFTEISSFDETQINIYRRDEKPCE